MALNTITHAEAGSIDDHIKATVIYPERPPVAKQLPFVDNDGDDLLISDIKEILFKDLPNTYLIQDYDLVFVQDNHPSIIAEEKKSFVAYLEKLMNGYKIRFDRSLS